MDQSLINWILAVFGSIIGFLIRSLWQGLKDLRDADRELTQKVHNINLLVAGKYVLKDELNMQIAAMFQKLDRIESKLDRKVDKHFNGKEL
jgi:hypothetical protein